MQRYKEQSINFRNRNKTLAELDSNLIQIYAECMSLFRKGSKVPYEQLNWDKINDFKGRFLSLQDKRKNVLPNDPLFDPKKEEIKKEMLNLLNLARSIIDDAFLLQNRLLNQLKENEKLKELENSKNDVVEVLKKQEKILSSSTTNYNPDQVHAARSASFFSKKKLDLVNNMDSYSNTLMVFGEPQLALESNCLHLQKMSNDELLIKDSITLDKVHSFKEITSTSFPMDGEQPIEIDQSRSVNQKLVEKSSDCSNIHMDSKEKDTQKIRVDSTNSESNLFTVIDLGEVKKLNEQEKSSSTIQLHEPYNFIKDLKDSLFKHKENPECSKHDGLNEIINIINKNNLSNFHIYQKIQKIVMARTRGWLDWYGKSNLFGAGRNQIVEALYEFIRDTLFDDINDNNVKAKKILDDLNTLLSVKTPNIELVMVLTPQVYEF